MTDHLFPSETEMVAVLSPIVADVAEQWGSIANIYELAAVRQADASTVLEPNNLPIQGVKIRLKQLTSELAQETFGLNTNVTMKGKMLRTVPVNLGDVFEIESGDFAGKNLEVTAVIERPLSDSYLLGLVDWEGEL